MRIKGNVFQILKEPMLVRYVHMQCASIKKKGDMSMIVFGWWEKDKIVSADDNREQAQEEVNPLETA